MNDKVFIDTNLLIYAISTDPVKTAKVSTLLLQPYEFVISTQVINEFANTCFRKNLLLPSAIRSAIEDFLLFFTVASIDEVIILTALELKDRYGYSYYDSLIVSTAIENGCAMLFSEDMQHGQIIGANLTIQNPLL